MTLREILDFVNFNARKSQEGDTMNADEFNTLIATFNVQIFEDEFASVELQARAQGLSVYDLLYTNSALRPFRIKTNITTAFGLANLPADYSHYITFLAKFGVQERIIEVVSEKVLNIKRTSLIESDPSISPVVAIYANQMQFLPKTIGASVPIEMVYLKKPSTPFYDECFANDSNLRIYMPAGSYITAATFISNIPNLYSSDGTLLQLGVNHSQWSDASIIEGGPAQIYTSKTVELEWEERMHLIMIQHLLAVLGVSLRTPLTNAPQK